MTTANVMTNRTRHLAVMMIAAAALLVGGVSALQQSLADHEASLPFYADAAFTPHWFDSAKDVPEGFHTIPAFSLINQKGERVSEADLDGRIVVANFFFTACPGICPSTMGNMRRVQNAFQGQDDVVMISHSVTPESDDVEALDKFATETNVIADTWQLLTGQRDVIYDLGKHGYFAEEDLGERAQNTGESVFLHTEQFFLLDGQQRIRGVYNGMNSTSVLQLIEDVKLLQKRS